MIITDRIDGLNIDDLDTILNYILDPFRFNIQLNSIKNEPLNKDFSKYYKYINENMYKSNKLTQLRILNQFCYSMNYFHVLLQHDLFPYDNFNNIHKILIADRMEHMYHTYYNFIFQTPAILSINTVKAYYLCLSLKKKINKYKKCGKLAWEEIQQCTINELNDILCSYNDNQYELIKNSSNTNEINNLLIIKYGLYINNSLYLKQLTNYVINNFNIVTDYINNYIALIYLNNKLYSNNAVNSVFEQLLYDYIMEKINIANNAANIIKSIDEIFSISSANSQLNKKLYSLRQSLTLLNKI